MNAYSIRKHVYKKIIGGMIGFLCIVGLSQAFNFTTNLSVSPTTAVSGTVVTYTVTISHTTGGIGNGNMSLTINPNVQITSSLPGGFSYIGNTISGPISIAGVSSQQLLFTGIVTASVFNQLGNNLILSSGTGMSTSSANIYGIPVVSIQKNYLGPDPQLSGDLTAFEIIVTNSGSAPANNLTILDNFPSSLFKYISSSFNGNNQSAVVDNFGSLLRTGTFTNLPAQSSHTIIVTGSLYGPHLPQTFLNRVSVFSSILTGYIPLVSASTSGSIMPVPDLQTSITRTSKNPVASGDIISWDVKFNNVGTTGATNIREQIFFSPELIYLSSSIAPSQIINTSNGTILLFSGLTLPHNGTIQNIYINTALSGNYTTGTQFTGMSRIQGNNIREISSDNNIATASGMVIDEILDFSINLSNTPTSAVSGTIVNYQAQITRISNSGTDNITLTLDIPTGIQIINIPSGFSSSGNTVVGNINMSGLSNQSFFFTGIVTTGIFSQLTSTVTLAGKIKSIGNSVSLLATPKLTIDKNYLGPDPQLSGDLTAFEIIVTNIGSTASSGFTIYDTFPTRLDYISHTMTGTSITPSISGRYITRSGFAPLDPDESIHIIITGALNQSLSPGSRFRNIVDLLPYNISAIDTGYVAPIPDLITNISRSGSNPVISGDRVWRTVNFANIGTLGANNVVGQVFIPNILTYQGSNVVTTAVTQTSSGTIVTFGGMGLPPYGANYDMNIYTVLSGNHATGTTFAVSSSIFSSGIREATLVNNTATTSGVVIDEILNFTTDFSVSPNTAMSGTIVAYQADIIRISTGSTNNFLLTINIPNGVQLVSLASGFSVSNNVATGTINMNGFSIKSFTFTGVVTTGVFSQLTSTLTLAGKIKSTGNSVSLSAIPQLSITKNYFGPDPQLIGDPVGFEIIVTNIGSTASSGFTIYDTFPTRLDYISHTMTGASITPSISGRYITRSGFAPLDPDESIHIIITGALNQNLPAGSLFRNIVTLLPDNISTRSTGYTAPIADLATSITRTTRNPVISGDRVWRTVNFVNSGSASANSIIGQIFIPNRLTYYDASHVADSIVTTSTGTIVTYSGLSLPGYGANATITIRTALNSNYNTGTTFSASSRIFSVPTVREVTLNNNASFASGKVVDEVLNFTTDFSVSPNTAVSGTVVTYHADIIRVSTGSTNNFLLTVNIPNGVQITNMPNGFSSIGNTVSGNINMNNLSNQSFFFTGLVTTGVFSQLTATLHLSGKVKSTGNSVSLSATPKLTIDKNYLGPDPQLSGDLTAFEIIVTNIGSTTSSGFSIYDRFPTRLRYVTSSFSGIVLNPTITGNNPNETGRHITWTGFTPLDPGESIIIVVTGELRDNFSAYTTFTNQATVLPHNISSTDTGSVAPISDLMTNISRTSVNPLISGDTVSWYVTYGNINSLPIGNVTHRIFIPKELTYNSASTTPNSVTATTSGTLLTFSHTSFGGYNTRSMTIDTTLNDNYATGTSFAATSTISSTSNLREVSLINNTSAASGMVVDEIFNFTVNITPSPTAAVSGTVVAYTTTITHTTTGTDTATFTFDFGSGIQGLTSRSPAFTLSGNTVYGSISMGGITQQSFTFTGIVTQRIFSQLTSVFTLFGRTTSMRSYATISSTPQLSITKNYLGPDPQLSGDLTAFEIIVSNSGSAPATGFTLYDTFPTRLDYISHTMTGASITPSISGRYITRSGFAPLDPDESIHIIITGALNQSLSPGSRFRNIIDLLPYNISAIDTGYVAPIPDLITNISRSGSNPVTSGDIVSRDVSFNNVGTTGVTDAVQQVMIPSILKYLSSNIAPSQLINTPNGTILLFSGITLPHNGSTQYIFIDTVLNDIHPGKTVFTGTSHITTISGHREISLVNNTSLATGIILEDIDLSISKKRITTLSGIVNGDNIVYEITVANEGNKVASGVTIIDRLPSILSSATGTLHIHGQTGATTQSTASGILRRENIMLGISQTGYIIVTGQVQGLHTTTTTITNTGQIIYATDKDQTNNITGVTDSITGLADLVIHKTQDVSYVARIGDKITYTITYQNAGERTLRNVKITDMLPSVFTASGTNNAMISGQFVSWTGMTLPPHSSGQIVFDAFLNRKVGSGTIYTNTVRGATDTAEATTGNNTATLTGQVIGIVGFIFDIQVTNITHPNFNSGNTVQAVQGDQLQITVDYLNIGNIDGENVSITLPLGNNYTNTTASMPVNIPLYTWSLGTLSGDTGGRITIRTTVSKNNFISMTHTGTFVYTISGDTKTLSDTITITEPAAVCGDGLITRNEPCDISGNIGPIGPGQRCIMQDNVCQLTTESIVNEVLLDRIAGNFVGTERAIVNIPILAPETPVCGEFEAEGGTVVIVEKDDDEYEGEADFRCETQDDQVAKITIDCGNGDTYTDIGTSLTATCEYNYDEDDVEDDDELPKEYDVKCLVEDVESTQCTQHIVVDVGFLAECGNGIREGYEQCDIEDNDYYDDTYDGYPIIDERLDDGHTRASNRYDDGDHYCRRCAIREKDDDFAYTPPSCFNVNTNLSVMENEVLPFWRRVDGTDIDITDGNSCTEERSIPEGSMKCTFAVYGPDMDKVEEFVTPCATDAWNSDPLFDYFKDSFDEINTDEALGRYYIDFAGRDIDIDTYGEYKLVLEEVEYDICDDNEDKIRKPQIIERVCQVNFAMTRPYLVQKSAFGALPKATTIDLSDFYAMDGERIIDKTDLKDIMVLDANEYKANPDVTITMNTFINEQSQRAITVDKEVIAPYIDNALSVTIKKVPGRHVYIFESDGASTLRLKELNRFGQPFTMIVKDMDLVVEGSMTNTYGMFLVQGGKVSFAEPEDIDRCFQRQTVNGIFMTDEGFGVEDDNDITVNNDFGEERCPYGSLEIRGVLIGDGIEDLVMQKRSHLTNWFHVQSNSQSAIERERRNEIFEGAAVLIEYNPTLRDNLPPGAESFSDALEVYKN